MKRSTRSDRAVSTSLSHVFAISITTTLIVVLTAGAGTYIQDQQTNAIEKEVLTVGNNLVSKIEQADGLAGQAGTELRLSVSTPRQIVGKAYRARIRPDTASACSDFSTDSCLVIEVGSVTEAFPLNNATNVALDRADSSTYVVTAGTGTPSAASNWRATKPHVDQVLESGIGRVPGSPATRGGTNLQPDAGFIVVEEYPEAGTNTTFKAVRARDRNNGGDWTRKTWDDGDIIAYIWDFDGDGVYDKAGKTVSWEMEGGTQEVELKVIDDGRLTDNETREVTVYNVSYDRLANQMNSTDTSGPPHTQVRLPLENTGHDKIEIRHVAVKPTAAEYTDIEFHNPPGNPRNNNELEVDYGSGWTNKSYLGSKIPSDGAFFELLGTENVSRGNSLLIETGGFRPHNPVFNDTFTIVLRYYLWERNETQTISVTADFGETPGATVGPNVGNFTVTKENREPDVPDGYNHVWQDNVTATFWSSQNLSKATVEFNRTRLDGSEQRLALVTKQANASSTVCTGDDAPYRCNVSYSGSEFPNSRLKDGRWNVTLLNVTGKHSGEVWRNRSGQVLVLNTGSTWNTTQNWTNDADSVYTKHGVLVENIDRAPEGTVRIGYPARDDQNANTDSLFGYWPLNARLEGYTSLGSGVRDGTAVGDVRNVSLGLHQSLSTYFPRDYEPGDQPYIDLESGVTPGLDALDGSGDDTFTAGVWFKPKNSSDTLDNATLVGETHGAEPGPGNRRSDWAIQVFNVSTCPSNAKCVGSPPYVGFVSGNSSANQYLMYGPVSGEQWQHVSITVDEGYGGSDDALVKLYYDGDLKATEPMYKHDHAGLHSGIGGAKDATGTVRLSFYGKLEDVRTYQRVLNETEVETHLYKPTSPDEEFAEDWQISGTLKTSKQCPDTQVDPSDSDPIVLRYHADISETEFIRLTVIGVEEGSGDVYRTTVTLKDGIRTTRLDDFPAGASGFGDIYINATMGSKSLFTSPELYSVQVTTQTPQPATTGPIC